MCIKLIHGRLFRMVLPGRFCFPLTTDSRIIKEPANHLAFTMTFLYLLLRTYFVWRCCQHFRPRGAAFFAGQFGKILASGRNRAGQRSHRRKTGHAAQNHRATRITAKLWLHLVPIDEIKVADRYDRGGNVRLLLADLLELEARRFITSFGGETSHEADVTQFAPLLQGVRSRVDCWAMVGTRFRARTCARQHRTRPDHVAPIYYQTKKCPPEFRRAFPFPIRLPIR